MLCLLYGGVTGLSCCQDQKPLPPSLLRPQETPATGSSHSPLLSLSPDHSRANTARQKPMSMPFRVISQLLLSLSTFPSSGLASPKWRILQLESIFVLCILSSNRKHTSLGARALASTVIPCFSLQLMNHNCPQILWLSD